MAEQPDQIVPIPSTDSEAEHRAVRKSNDKDQARERSGEVSRHNEGYDQAAGTPRSPADARDDQ